VPPRPKTPTKRTTPAKRVPPASAQALEPGQAAIDPPSPDAAPDASPFSNATVTFHGRSIEVVFPTQEQITVLRMLGDEFTADGLEDRITTGDEVIDATEMAINAITSVIVNRADIMFIKKLLLTKKTTLTEAGVILTHAMASLEAENTDLLNREGRRAAEQARGDRGTATLATA
jgi:hypothetical protein